MKGKLLDISTKIDPFTLDLLKIISTVAKENNVEFFIVGATARDIVFSLMYELKTTRATNDIDFSVRVQSWAAYDKLLDGLKDKGFEKTKIIHKFNYKGVPSIDIIPFGKISVDSKTILWPDSGAKEMSILGQEESFNDAELVLINSNPNIIIRIASARGLTLLKLISWKDGYPGRSRDAIDILYILNNYLDAGNQQRLFDSHFDLVNDEFDYNFSGARLLGRDIKALANEDSLSLIVNIVEENVKITENSKLIADMLSGDVFLEQTDEKYDYCRKIIENLYTGLTE